MHIYYPYSLLEHSNLLVRQRIRLGNDRNQVDLGVQSAHDLDIQGLQGMAGGLDEVDACVDSVIHDVHPVHLVLRLEVCVKALFNVLDDRAPRIVVVNEIAESWCVHHCQTETHSVLFNVCADRLDGHSLWDDVEAWALALLRRIQGRVEEGIDQSRLAQTRFASKILVCYCCTMIVSQDLPTTITLKLNPFRTLFRCH